MWRLERGLLILCTLAFAWIRETKEFPISDDISASVLPPCTPPGDTIELTCTTPLEYELQYWVSPHPNVTEVRDSDTGGKFTLYNFNGVGRYELSVSNATEEDGGTYMCVFINGSGELVAQSITVSYQDPVNFLTSNGLTHQVLAGSNASVQCLAENYDDIQWLYHNFTTVKMSSSLKRVHTAETNGGILLLLMDVVFQDNGTYYCSAKNKVTLPIKIQAFIQVYAQPTVTVTPLVATVKEFENVSFTCNASGFSQLLIEWCREDGSLLNPSTRLSIVQESECILSVLHLYSVAITDAGDYYCSAIYPHGRENASATLTIISYCRTLPTNVEAHLIGQHNINITWLPPVCINSLTENYTLIIKWWTVSNNMWSHIIQDPFNTTHYTITDVDTQATYFITVSAGGNTSNNVITITTGIVVTMEDTSGSVTGVSALPIAVGTVAGACFLTLVILIFIPTIHSTYLRNKLRACREAAANNDAAYASHNVTADDVMDNDRSMDSVAQRPAIPAPDTSYTVTKFRGLVSDVILIPSTCISILDFIGQGEFGIVFKAHLNHPRSSMLQIAAVKTLKGFLSHEKVTELLMESVKMKDFDHPNVLSLIGICVDGGPAPYIVMPFMANGSLLSYLRKERESLVVSDMAVGNTVVVSQKKLLDILLQIAKGMEYLAGKGVLHRDLAARNCMIDSGFIIKVADFGMSESVYSRDYFRQEMQSEAKIPVKWMAPESLSDGIFTEKTDVWSFGVTFWEVCTGGKIPYSAVSPRALPQLLEQGERLTRPFNTACTDDMCSVMESCWNIDPQQRPSFSQLVSTIATHLSTLSDYLQL